MEETENEMLHLEKPTDYQLLKMKYVKNGMSYPTFILQKRFCWSSLLIPTIICGLFLLRASARGELQVFGTLFFT